MFDANVRIGRFAASRGPHFADAPALLSAMDRLGIERALVYGAMAREAEAAPGNRLLLDQVAEHPRLVPAWVVVPNREPAEQTAAKLASHGVRAVRLYPHAHHFPFRPWCVGPLADALAARGIPAFVDFESPAWSDDRIDWEGIVQVCAACPSLRLVVSGVTTSGPVKYAHLLGRCPNLCLETSQLIVPGEVRRLVEEGFADRLLFSTEIPARHPGGPLAMLAMEDLPDLARRAICGDNLARLLGCPPAAAPPPPAPTATDIVDTHVHLGGWNNSSCGQGDAASIVRQMDRCGIASVIATSLWACFGEVALGNQAVADAVDAFPGRICGYLTLDPKYPAEVQAQLDRYGDDPRFPGLKLHCGTHAVPVDAPLYRPILEHADRRALPVLVHHGLEPAPWLAVCRRYPRANFIVAHVSGCGHDVPQGCDLARACRLVPNLHVDIAASRAYYGYLEDLVELAGPDRVLYGSDHPLFDFGFELGQVFSSQLPPSLQAQILAGNARRLFRLQR